MSTEEYDENNKTSSREDLEYLRMSASELNNFAVNLFELGDTELALKFYKEALHAMMIVIPDGRNDIDSLDLPETKKRFQSLLKKGNTHVQSREKKKKKLEWSNPIDIYPLLNGVDNGGMVQMVAYKAIIPHKSKRKQRKHKTSDFETGIPVSNSNDEGEAQDETLDNSIDDEKMMAQMSNEMMNMSHHPSETIASHRWSPMTCLPFGPLRMSSGLLDVPLGEVELITRNNISIVVDTPLPRLAGQVSRDTILEGQEVSFC